MRISVLLATSLLLAGCSNAAVQPHGQTTTPSTSSARPTSSAPHSSAMPTPSAAPTGAPAAGADIGAVIAWVEAGSNVEAGGFHTATRDGAATDLDGDIAFVTAERTNCMTDKDFHGALACLTHPKAPLPQPADAVGHWVPGWVDFEGPTAEVGSVHGDPGRFNSGTGSQLKAGQSVAFGDYRCRPDAAGLICVNYAHRTAVRFSDGGIETFGCLKPVTPPADGFGRQFACKAA